MPEPTKIAVPAATLERLRNLDRVIDLCEDRVLKVQNLRTALTTLYPVGTRSHTEFLRVVERALSNLGHIHTELKFEWERTMPDAAISMDDLVAED